MNCWSLSTTHVKPNQKLVETELIQSLRSEELRVKTFQLITHNSQLKLSSYLRHGAAVIACRSSGITLFKVYFRFYRQ